jgi:hypothetical protein
MQTAKMPGLMKKEHGEFNRSGFQPSVNLRPVTQIICIGWTSENQLTLIRQRQSPSRNASADQGEEKSSAGRRSET